MEVNKEARTESERRFETMEMLDEIDTNNASVFESMFDVRDGDLKRPRIQLQKFLVVS